MEDRLINLARPDEIIKELFNDNSEILNKFAGRFSEEILEFAELFSKAYKSFLELVLLTEDTENEQKEYVSRLTSLLLDNLMMSVKLFIFGYQIPSGNLMRQVLESVALAILCSLNDKITISVKKNKPKEIHFYTRFVNNGSEAKSSLALKYLEDNSEKIGINKNAIDTLKEIRSIYHHFSHPGELSLSVMQSFEKPGKMYVCGSFDEGKIDQYKKDLLQRIEFCKRLPNIIEGLIYNVKQLT